MFSCHATETSDRELDSVAGSLWAVLALITLWRLWAAWALPVTQDEAYYFDWAHSLAWGYFDHPPGVALLGVGTLLAPGSALAGRLGTVLAATLSLLLLARFYRNCGLRGGELLVAVIIACMTLPGLASGVLATPDTALGLGWALALHEGLAALRGERRRWLSAGVATGLGLLGKYTMVLIGPVFLWAILWVDPRALRTPWPYLGGLAALLVFGPNLLWNAQNDWLTIRFQVGHGFSTETGTLVANPLPLPVGYPDRATELPPIQYSPVEAIDGLLGFLGTQAALWGLLALPLIVGVIRCCRRKPQGGQRVLDSPAKALLVAGSFFPLAFFSLIATFSEVEPNWPGMYLSTAAPLAALATERMRRWVMIGGGGNLLLVSLYVLHGATGILPLLDGQNRVLRESQGYSELAHRLAILPEPVFADRYQIVAMTRFYAPIRQTTQWPGISRPSEYLRGTVAATVTREEIEQAGGFWLLSKRFEPLEFPGFKLRSQSSIFHCRDRALVEAPTDAALPCSHPLHRWQLFGYVTDATRPSTGARGD